MGIWHKDNYVNADIDVHLIQVAMAIVLLHSVGIIHKAANSLDG